MENLPRIRFESKKYPYINQLLVDRSDLRVEMNTNLYNSFIVKGLAESVYPWVLDKQIELFRKGLEVAVMNRQNLDDGQVEVLFAAKFPKENLGK